MIVLLYILGGLCVILGGLLLLSMRAGNHRSTAPFDRLPIAHRGLHTEDGEAPENSLEAFKRAKEAGYAIEFDVQFTLDKQIVVFHDATLERVCGVNKRVDACTYAELQTYALQGGSQKIPLLSEVLDVLDGAPIVCEIKSYGANNDTSLCAATWPFLASYKGPLCIESFNPFMVRWFYQHQPQVLRGILSTCYDDIEEVTFWQGVALTALMTNFLTKPDFVAYDYEYHHKLSFRLCRALFRPTCIAWTIMDAQQHAACQTLFDNCIFEQFHPDITC